MLIKLPSADKNDLVSANLFAFSSLQNKLNTLYFVVFDLTNRITTGALDHSLAITQLVGP